MGAAAPHPIFLMTVGGNESLGGIYNWSWWWKHGIRAWNLWWKWYKLENLLQSYVNFIPSAETSFSWTFKVLKPTSFRRLCTLDPRQGRPPSSDPTRGPKKLSSEVVKQILISIVVQVHEGMIMIVAYAGGSSLYPKGGHHFFSFDRGGGGHVFL